MSMKSNERLDGLAQPSSATEASEPAALDWFSDRDEVDSITLLRDRLAIPESISDVTIAASLAAISAKGGQRERWLAAFSSPLGKWLAMRGADLNTVLNVVISFAPKASS
ncbi:MAG: hypothetical protein R3D68_19270 [Hyphomicrobiaceae bacterium]